MNKNKYLILILLVSITMLLVGFNVNKNETPSLYYQIYLDDEIIGTIKSSDELKKYIDEQGETYKQNLNVDKVLIPNGMTIREIYTYANKLNTVEEVYNKICDKKPFTIKGYQFNIRKSVEDKNKNIVINVLDKSIVENAIKKVIGAFVDDAVFQSYIDNNQVKIVTTGRETENIYILETVTFKEVNISVNDKIFKDVDSLAQFLLFNNNTEKKQYQIKQGETIELVAYNNEISVNELVMSNPEISKKNHLIYPGQIVDIKVPDPLISVVIEEYVIEDLPNKFKIIEEFDKNLSLGKKEVRTKGIDGLLRVTQRVKTINGVINYINPINTIELKPATDQIVALGTKYIPTVGTTGDWLWPTRSGYTITSDFGYRIDPFNGSRTLHNGIDIAGMGYGGDIYAASNGVVKISGYTYDYGYYVVINHNNGYYSIYGHMISQPLVEVGQTVSRGEILGYIGSTGMSTGPHLHFEVWKDREYNRISPWEMFK